MRKFLATFMVLIVLCFSTGALAQASPASDNTHQVQVLHQRIHDLRQDNRSLSKKVAGLNATVLDITRQNDALTEQVSDLKGSIQYNTPAECNKRFNCFNQPVTYLQGGVDFTKVYRVFFVEISNSGDAYRFYAGPYFSQAAADAAATDLKSHVNVVDSTVKIDSSPTNW